MSISKILVTASGTDDGLGAVETALLVARRFDAHVEVVNVRRNPRDAVAFMTEGMTGAVIEEIITTAEQDIERRAGFASDSLKQLAEKHGVDITTLPPRRGLSIAFIQDEGREDEVIAERGRLSDLVIAPRPTSDGDAKEEVVAESVLMASGSGLLLVPARLRLRTFGQCRHRLERQRRGRTRRAQSPAIAAGGGRGCHHGARGKFDERARPRRPDRLSRPP